VPQQPAERRGGDLVGFPRDERPVPGHQPEDQRGDEQVLRHLDVDAANVAATLRRPTPRARASWRSRGVSTATQGGDTTSCPDTLYS
jgi:hypothetical protein